MSNACVSTGLRCFIRALGDATICFKHNFGNVVVFEAVASIVSFYTHKGYYIYIGILHIYRYNYTYEKCRPESKSAELRCVR